MRQIKISRKPYFSEYSEFSYFLGEAQRISRRHYPIDKFGNSQIIRTFALTNDVSQTNIGRKLQEHTLTSVCL